IYDNPMTIRVSTYLKSFISQKIQFDEFCREHEEFLKQESTLYPNFVVESYLVLFSTFKLIRREHMKKIYNLILICSLLLFPALFKAQCTTGLTANTTSL